MESATERFFKIPELFNIVKWLLPKKDLFHLMLTCRFHYLDASSILHRDVFIEFPWNTFRPPLPECRFPMARRMEHVRRLLIDEAVSRFLYFRLENPTTRPKPFSFHYLPPLGYMTAKSRKRRAKLRRARARLLLDADDKDKDKDKNGDSSDDDVSTGLSLESLCAREVIAAQFRHSIQFCHRLAVLRVDQVRIPSRVYSNYWARTISGIATLEALSLGFVWDWSTLNYMEDIITDIYFACPISLKVLVLQVQPGDPERYRSWENEKETAALERTLDGPLVRRQEPLHNLKVWQVWQPRRWSERALWLLLGSSGCKEIVSLEIPVIQTRGIDNAFAAFLCQEFPQLRNLSQDMRHCDHGDSLFPFFEHMKEETLESLCLYRFQEKEKKLGVSLKRHYGSLRRVELHSCSFVDTESIQEILFKCRVLEIFKVNGVGGIGIGLKDLVQQGWSSVNIQELELIIDVGSVDPPMSKPRSEFTMAEEEQALLFERFYRQIGAQAALRCLNLRVKMTGDLGDKDIRKLNSCWIYTFPGLLTLGDDDAPTGRWGCLRYLAGLTRLETIRGLFSVEDMMAGYTLQPRDIDWIAQFWPRLREVQYYANSQEYATFFRATMRENESSPCVELLQEKLPKAYVKPYPRYDMTVDPPAFYWVDEQDYYY